MKATFATVKSDAEYQKRKTVESYLGKPPPPAKRARADENVHAQQRTSALIEELLERETRQFGSQPPLAMARQQENAGPTDFTGLFPKAAAADVLGLPGQQPQRAARTFEDLAQRQTRQVLADLPASYLPEPVARLHASDATNLSAAAAAIALRDKSLPASTSAPLDWSLKTTVRFTSPTPFSIAEEAMYLSGGAVVQARRAFSSCQGVDGLSMQQRYLATLHSWQFPADPKESSGGSTAKLRGVTPELAARRTDWQTAFASLYSTLRSGACDAFYYLSPEGTKKPFAVFFGVAGVGGRPRLHALLTRSTSGLRALMTGGLALGFEAPLLPSEADRRAAELDQSAVPLDGSQSLLLFEGGVRVHGIFDFLLNESFRSHGDDCDVPLLLAPVQFAQASLQAMQPKVLGVCDARDASRALHRLELRGSALPPWVLHRLTSVLATTQDGNFSMACDTHLLTLALNWCPSSSSSSAAAVDEQAGGGTRRRQALASLGLGLPEGEQLTEYEARGRGCWDAAEAAQWRAAVPGLSCNVVRELRCEGSMFTAKLSAKSAERIVL